MATYSVCSPLGYWSSGRRTTYALAHDRATGTWTPVNFGMQRIDSSNDYAKSLDVYIIYRGIIGIDLTTLSPSTPVNEASLVVPDMLKWATHRDIWGCLVDATGITTAESGYGDMRDRTTILGSVFIPSGTGFSYSDDVIILNSAGRTFIEDNAGGIAQFGLRQYYDIMDTAPGNSEAWDERQTCGIDAFGDDAAYLLTGGLGGYIWVEGTKFSYTDGYGTKRQKEGTDTGNNGIAGFLWIEGNYLHYIDANGDERRIEGTQQSATGKVGGHIWIDGNYMRYIDSSGNERYITGIA